MKKQYGFIISLNSINSKEIRHISKIVSTEKMWLSNQYPDEMYARLQTRGPKTLQSFKNRKKTVLSDFWGACYMTNKKK